MAAIGILISSRREYNVPSAIIFNRAYAPRHAPHTYIEVIIHLYKDPNALKLSRYYPFQPILSTMKSSAIFSFALLGANSVFGHAIFQRIKVNDVDQGQLVGVRAPSSNNPVQSVTGDSIACNTGLVSPVSQAVVKIPAGAKVSAWYQHVIGGPQFANDADNPIAASHKGPLIAYLAKV